MERRFRVLVAIYGVVVLAMMACKKDDKTNKKQIDAQPVMATISANEKY